MPGTPRDLLNTYYSHFEPNLIADIYLDSPKKNEFYNHLDVLTIIDPLNEKKELLDHCNKGFFWLRDVSGKRKYKLIGIQPPDWKAKEVIGRAVLLDIFLENIYWQNPTIKLSVNITNFKSLLTKKFQLNSIGKLIDSDRHNIISDFVKQYQTSFLASQNAIMWSFRADAGKRGDFQGINKDDLPMRLGLNDYTKNSYICFLHELDDIANTPTTFDAGLDLIYFMPGGKTKAMPPLTVSDGMDEIVHEPNQVKDLKDFL